MTDPNPKFDAEALTAWASAIFQAREVTADKAEVVARILVEGDLLGHDTHGLNLLGPYLDKLQSGELRGDGDIEIVSDKPAATLWDAHLLPGPWVTDRAVDLASRRARELGTAVVSVRRAGHIACLAAYLEAPARSGLLVEIHSSDPAVATVAPYGGKQALFTPNPIAFGIPTGSDPIMIDISSSITTNGMSARLAAAGRRFDHPWLLDADGNPTDDPTVFNRNPKGTIQLLGGVEAGHKGYGLALMVEANTGGLAGHGRADKVEGWGATLMVRVTDPEALGGLGAFNRQLDWLVAACRSNPPIDVARPVRVPGERGLARKRDALENGLALHPNVLTAVQKIASEFDKPLPD